MKDVWSVPAAPVATTRMILQLQPVFLVQKVISHLIMGQQFVCSVKKVSRDCGGVCHVGVSHTSVPILVSGGGEWSE